MGRKYTKEEYITLFDKLRKIPNMAISTDIIVGFPGETEEDFNETLELCEYCKYDNAFTFIFSPREGTPASKIKDNTTLEEKEQRLYKLNELVNKYFLESNKKYVGKTVKVLVEGESEKEGMLFGYSPQNKLVNFYAEKEDIGKIIDVEIEDAKTWSLDGKKIK
jgi:tRNA-2-methylthio-N6-dimethylallyladenosine synthase